MVEVEWVAVNLWRVVEPTTSRSPDELMVEVALPPMRNELAWRRLEKKLVEVALVVVDLVISLKMWAPVQVGVKD